ncbi:MAG: DNA polymerase Y family protein [Pseudomonadota bacterium]
MSQRRVLSLWFPRLGAERCLRVERGTVLGPLAVVGDNHGAQVLHSVSGEASAAGLRQGQPLRDAMAMCPELITRPHVPQAEAALLTGLRRWAGKFSPWVAEEAPDGLVIDLTGCAHLFGGERPLVDQVTQDCADLGLTVRAGIADTLGAAWALARFSGEAPGVTRSGDAIDQEARATRSRAAKRRALDLAAPPSATIAPGRIAAPGQTRQAIGHLPVAALRISEADATGLARLGLRRIGDLTGMPRAALARRFGMAVGQRLDQALGIMPEPVSPARPEDHFATRLTLPDPIGLRDDLEAGIDRLLPPLLEKLRKAGKGARRVRLQAFRTDHGVAEIDVGLARPSADSDRIRPLLCLKLDEIDAGHGIDSLRLEAHVTEPVHARQMKGHLDAAQDVSDRLARNTGLDDLIGRLGARVGMDAITRLHPADSHIPEKTHQTLAAAWSEPATHWPPPPTPRPLLMWPPEPVQAPQVPALPRIFRWRRRDWHLATARGPERLSPEWWLDDPSWRSGVRDYWEVTTESGARLWLYFAHGGAMSGGWFCQGSFE